MPAHTHKPLWTQVPSVCRMDADASDAILSAPDSRTERAWMLLLIAGMSLTGAVFGIWRSPQQAFFGAVKMPVMMLATVALSAGAATMFNGLLGFGLTFGQVRRCVTVAMAAASLLLGSLSPVVLLLVVTLPAPASPHAVGAYRILLGTLVTMVGVAGVLGTLRLYRLMLTMAATPSIARRTLAAWVLVMGLVGTQTSWLLSPFVQRPQQVVTFWNPLAFDSNFFEYLWHAAARRNYVDQADCASSHPTPDGQ